MIRLGSCRKSCGWERTSHNWIGTFLSVTMDKYDSEGPSILFSELNRYNRTLKIDWNWKALSWRHDSQFPVSNSNASNVQYCSIHVHEKLSKLPKCRKKKYKNRTFFWREIHVKTVVESYFLKLNFCKGNILRKNFISIKM